MEDLGLRLSGQPRRYFYSPRLYVLFCVVGLCPDWDSWDASKPVNNAREAMQQADDWLGIPQVYSLTGPCS